jgi:glycosyltransferase involved in cell wall biosynthesis
VLLNRSLANSTKLELIVGILRSKAHDVEVLSQGEVVDDRFRFYPAFREAEPFDEQVPVFYSSALSVRHLNALWSSLRLRQLLNARNKVSPFDLVIVWNLKHPQIICAQYALRKLGVPVVLEYEDDAFVDRFGVANRVSLGYRRLASRVLRTCAGCLACSPHLLSQAPGHVPKLLLRGVVGNDLASLSKQGVVPEQNWVLFSGTHSKQYAVDSLIRAWGTAGPPGWQLHITGQGEDTAALRDLASTNPTIRFHGLVPRSELVKLMLGSKICMNPHDTSQTPGNLFAFKIIEYLAAGAHVITTPMGELEKELETGITYMADNRESTIAATLASVIRDGAWQKSCVGPTLQRYGPEAVSSSIENFLRQVIGSARSMVHRRNSHS